MSFYDDASLVVIPSAQKTSKLYAVKPTDGSGDLAFTRTGDTASRINSAGLIEKVRTNLLLQSQTFDNASWTKTSAGTGSNPVVTANNGTAPDGTTTADKVVFVATDNTGISELAQNCTKNGTYAGSIYIKAFAAGDVGKIIGFRFASGTYVLITLTADWQRFLVSQTGSLSTFDLTLRPSQGTSTGTVSVYIWGAQLETGDVATDYIPTLTAAVSTGPVANVPRLDYLGSTCPRLLLEPQRTNAILWSEQINTTNWPASTRINVTENALISPDGYQNADVIIPNTTSGNHGPAQNVSGLTSGATYSCSIYAKAQGYSKFLILAGAGTGSGQYEFDLTAGTAQAGATITSVGNGWYRCTAPLVPNSSLLQYLIFISNGSAYSYAGNGTSGIAFWGAQVEAGAYATSYIPTLAASATRGADACSKTGISSLIGQTEGTFFLEIDLRNLRIPDSYIFIRNAAVTGYIGLRITGAALRLEAVNTSTQVAIDFPVTSTGVYKLGMAYKANDYAYYVNGAQVGVDTSATVPTCDILDLNFNLPSTNSFGIAQALLFKTRLSNAALAELTTL